MLWRKLRRRSRKVCESCAKATIRTIVGKAFANFNLDLSSTTRTNPRCTCPLKPSGVRSINSKFGSKMLKARETVNYDRYESQVRTTPCNPARGTAVRVESHLVQEHAIEPPRPVGIPPRIICHPYGTQRTALFTC